MADACLGFRFLIFFTSCFSYYLEENFSYYLEENFSYYLEENFSYYLEENFSYYLEENLSYYLEENFSYYLEEKKKLEKYHLPVPFLITCKRTVNSWAWSVSNIKIRSGHRKLFLENKKLIIGSKCFLKRFLLFTIGNIQS